MFDNLTEVKEGDVFYIHVLNQTLAYEVNQIKVVLPENTSDLLIDRNEDYVTMVTCTPYGINSHRLLVRGTRIPYREAKKKEHTQTKKDSKWKAYVLAAIIAVILLLIAFIYRRYQEKKRRRRMKRKRVVKKK